MKRILLVFLALLLIAGPAAGRADRYKVLDAALSMLEEGNPFLERYNGETGAGIEARYPLGCPYFWGGRYVTRILVKASPEQESDWYKKDRKYLYGLDCAGFTRWATEQAGYAQHDSISNLLNKDLYKDAVIYEAAKVTGNERAALLRPGDLLAIRHEDGSFHIAMFIGTLLDFGYNAKTLPEELAPYLHYPLLIHCTGSSDYFVRYKKWLRENGDTETEPPYGGVIVTLLDAPVTEATGRTPAVQGLDAPCFELEGYHLQITDLGAERQTRWIRWREK